MEKKTEGTTFTVTVADANTLYDAFRSAVVMANLGAVTFQHGETTHQVLPGTKLDEVLRNALP